MLAQGFNAVAQHCGSDGVAWCPVPPEVMYHVLVLNRARAAAPSGTRRESQHDHVHRIHPARARARHRTARVGCIKKVNGWLPIGGSFEVGGNVYESLGCGSAQLSSYGSSSKNPKFKTVTYGNHKYRVYSVGPKAFATPQGAKVKSVEFEWLLACGKNAFTGTKSLAKLKLGKLALKEKRSGGKLKSVSWDGFEYVGRHYMYVEKGAFAKCGKNGGKGLTVELRGGTPKADASKYRKLFTSRGMGKGFKLKTKG